MRVGISLTSNHPDVTDPRQGARWMIERAAAARRAVLDSLFVGDQHVSATPYYQNTPMLGRLLAEWGEAPAGCLFLLPLWHPVLVAEQIGTLAAITRGPFIMQCGLGWGDARFAAMGANIRTRPSVFEEALDIVRRLLAGETVSSARRFRIAEASLALRPAEPVEVWIGASALPAIDRAARLSEGWIASPGLTREEAQVQADLYRERCAAYGKEPGAVVLRRDIYVGGSSSRGAGGIATGVEPKLSRYAGRSPDRGLGRRGRGTVSHLRGNRLHRNPGAPSDQRSAEGPGLAGAAGRGTRGAGMKRR
jgi:alkanesulfonate monooxygenase SsuD/methylene tetrahydromethanopterin reductase-like flavin-dependent oxidoreductase (luciferase family)